MFSVSHRLKGTTLRLKGTTLIELLIAISLSLIIIQATFDIYLRNKKNIILQNQLLQMKDDACAAINSIRVTINNALMESAQENRTPTIQISNDGHELRLIYPTHQNEKEKIIKKTLFTKYLEKRGKHALFLQDERGRQIELVENIREINFSKHLAYIKIKINIQNKNLNDLWFANVPIQ